jgi:hypothetical protein
MGDLVHDKVGVLEEAQDAIVEFDANVVAILFHAERAENKVLHPMVVNLLDDGYEVLGLDDLAQLDPGRPEEGELVD